jgi:hypothetical protein
MVPGGRTNVRDVLFVSVACIFAFKEEDCDEFGMGFFF